ncbi:hypothetical protein RRF57_006422 [Xylaria bambusicola]|uniref:DUF1996 domain-containing protein n=1 Tax=Xylaria bambusicola TaxID=326684 RepID=A0AAN7Z5K1_9PEZI
MKWTSVRALALAVPVQAGLRFQCSTLTIQRLDPVVQPGSNPSAHLHHIVGGNAFNATMLGDVASRATCTTCEMSEDFSNYWTATLFFKHPTNGSYHRVPVIPVNPGNLDGYSGTSGGLTVYYTQTDLVRDSIATNPVKTFPPTVGSPTNTGAPHVGLRYQCLSAGGGRGPEIADFPTSPCAGGIVSSLLCLPLPISGDVSGSSRLLDRPVLCLGIILQILIYAGMARTSTAQTTNRTCITLSPWMASQMRLSVLRVTQFGCLRSLTRLYGTLDNSTQVWPSGTKNPFVWSFEGVNGKGTHADYMFGWKGDALQRAMNKSECFYDGCGSITKQPMATANET